eukprot:COSAG01_NODE_1540_length_9985_cov_7.634855_3_plen_521_part_00
MCGAALRALCQPPPPPSSGYGGMAPSPSERRCLVCAGWHQAQLKNAHCSSQQVQTLCRAARFEAEAGTLSGPTKVASTIAGYSGSGYITGFTSQDCAVTVVLATPSAGLYEITIGYHVATNFGDKGFGFVINSAPAEKGTFTTTGSGWGRVSVGKHRLPAGASNATVLDGWGYFEVDYVDVTPATATPPKAPPKTLADPAATPTARKLMSFLVDTFGRRVIAGTQVRKPSLDAVAYATKASGGKAPGMIEGGLLDYSPTFVARAGNVTNGYVEALGRWASSAADGGGRGLLALCWHWNAPSDLMDTKEHPDKEHPWFQAFYTKNTNYDLAFALANPSSYQYVRLVADLDAIALQLTKLSQMDVPVLWRPLHEASGGWFWWGAKGPGPFKQLWKLMFQRFTQVHRLHNLIWVYTADPAAHHEWYPGDGLVDVVGADIYEPAGSDMAGTWEAFRAQYSGQKLIALSETGGMPVPDALRTEKTLWSWFNTWDITQYNITAAEIRVVYTSPLVLTLDELPDWRA